MQSSYFSIKVLVFFAKYDVIDLDWSFYFYFPFSAEVDSITLHVICLLIPRVITWTSWPWWGLLRPCSVISSLRLWPITVNGFGTLPIKIPVLVTGLNSYYYAFICHKVQIGTLLYVLNNSTYYNACTASCLHFFLELRTFIWISRVLCFRLVWNTFGFLNHFSISVFSLAFYQFW